MPGEMVPIVMFVVLGVVGTIVGFSFSPLGKGLARRLTGGKDTELEAEIENLKAELDALRAELDSRDARIGGQIEETSSRLDFAERLLAQSRSQGVLPPAQS